MTDVSPLSRRPERSASSRAGIARIPRIPLNLQLLVVSEDFGAGLTAESVAAALARGLRRGGLPDPDTLALSGAPRVPDELRAELDGLGLPARLPAARALVIAAAQLRSDRLATSAAFELATRARQGGVPAYAVAAESELDAFQARILDLQLILEASDVRGLAAAGRRLARDVLAGMS
jgi:hypothetical protein